MGGMKLEYCTQLLGVHNVQCEECTLHRTDRIDNEIPICVGVVTKQWRCLNIDVYTTQPSMRS